MTENAHTPQIHRTKRPHPYRFSSSCLFQPWASRSAAAPLSSKCQGALLAHIWSIFICLLWCWLRVWNDVGHKSCRTTLWSAVHLFDAGRLQTVCLIPFTQPGQKDALGHWNHQGAVFTLVICGNHTFAALGEVMHQSCLHQLSTIFELEAFCSVELRLWVY